MQSGTSFAAAQISGVAALILERNPSLDAAAVQRILMSTARDLGPAGAPTTSSARALSMPSAP